MRRLADIFRSACQALENQRQTFNRLDVYNGNHGDHMVEIFELAANKLQGFAGGNLAEAMQIVSQALETLQGNGSAQVYASGLKHLALQFQAHDLHVEDLTQLVATALDESTREIENTGKTPLSAKGDLLKALATALDAWRVERDEKKQAASGLSLGSLFEFGMAYLQAKQRGGDHVTVLADAAASVSPLGSVPHRFESGKFVLRHILQALQQRDFN